MIRSRHTARFAAQRLGAGMLALCACAAQAEGPGRPLPAARVIDGLHAFVTAATAAGDSPAAPRVPLLTLPLPIAGAVHPMQLDAHMTIGNQPRKSSAIVFSTVVPF